MARESISNRKRIRIGIILLTVFIAMPLTQTNVFSANHGRKPGWRDDGRHGHVIRELPRGYNTIRSRGSVYYFNRGFFYRRRPAATGYIMVHAPIGAIIATLPVGFLSIRIGGSTYFSFGGTYYRRVPQGYLIVAPPPEMVVYPPPALNNRISVTAGILNVRSGPGLQHPVIFRITQGTVLTVQGSAPGWYYVQLPNGRYGWIMVQFTATMEPPPEG